MKVHTVNGKPWFEFKETDRIGMACVKASVEDAVKASKEILKHYEPESLAVEKFNWKVKGEYFNLLDLYSELVNGFTTDEDELYLNYSELSESYELNSNSEGGNFKTFFTEEEFLAFAEPLNLEKFFEPVKN